MPQAPLYAYLGVRDGKPELCVSSYPLQPWGGRVVKGRSAPVVINEHLAHSGDSSLAVRALIAAARYFAGEEYGIDQPVFGEKVPAKRRKKDHA
jgi:hypothetical protein